MYDAVADDYCYPGKTVLKNKLDLRDADELADFEAEVSDARLTFKITTAATTSATRILTHFMRHVPFCTEAHTWRKNLDKLEQS